jgi:hypothetical protein
VGEKLSNRFGTSYSASLPQTNSSKLFKKLALPSSGAASAYAMEGDSQPRMAALISNLWPCLHQSPLP